VSMVDEATFHIPIRLTSGWSFLQHVDEHCHAEELAPFF